MKDLRKVLAVIIAAAMVFGIASCAQPLDDQKANKRSETEEDEGEDEVTEESEESEETEKSEISDETEPSEETEETEESSVEETFVDDVDDARLLGGISGVDVLNADEFNENYSDPDYMSKGFLVYAEGDEINNVLMIVTSLSDDTSPYSDNCISLTSFERNVWDDESSLYEKVVVFEYEDEDSASKVFQAMVGIAPDLSVSKLSEEEYGKDGSTGHLVVHFDRDETVEAMLEFWGDLANEEVTSAIEGLNEADNVISFYQVGNKAFLVQFSSHGACGSSVVLDYLAERGLGNPLEVDSSDEAVECFKSFILGSVLM